ncbi:MAG: GIY-YIG nuclease family protein, partial [Candidatus Buchananbacteria bacterium]
MFYYVYILESELVDKELYIGYTNDLRKRLTQHNSGSSQSTKRYLPWKLIYYEACIDINDAKRREKYF